MSKRRVPPEPPGQAEESPRPYAVTIAPAAAKALEGLPRDLGGRVRARIRALSTEPRGHGVQKLSAREGEYRVRAGDIRVLFTVDDAARVVLVGRVEPRDKAYR